MKKYRKFNLIIVLLLIVAFSNTGTFAAFNDEISNILESYNGTNNSLAIKNGKIQLDFSSEDSSKVWRIGGTDGTVIPATGEITKLNGDKVSKIRATYGPILIKNTSDYYKINETFCFVPRSNITERHKGGESLAIFFRKKRQHKKGIDRTSYFTKLQSVLSPGI